MRKRKAKLVQIKCESCKCIFTGETWKTECIDCWKATKKQEAAEQGIPLERITKICPVCDGHYEGEHWKTMCPKCYHNVKKDEKTTSSNVQEIICDTCNGVFRGASWRTQCKRCWILVHGDETGYRKRHEQF